MGTVGRARRRGNFAIIFGFLITALLGFAALAIDLAYVRNSRMQLQNATDAAAHAAIVALRAGYTESAAREVAKDVARANTVGYKPLSLADADIQFGTWDFDRRLWTGGTAVPNAVRVDATRDETALDGPLRLFFAPVLKIYTADAEASATSAFRYRKVMMTFDVTGSFQQSIDRGRDATIGFLDYMCDQATGNDKIGMVLFANVGMIYDELQEINDGNCSSLRSHWQGDGRTTCNVCTGNIRTSTFNSQTGFGGITVCNYDGLTASRTGITYSCSAPTGSYTYPPAPFDKCEDNIRCHDGAPAGYEEGTAQASGLELAIDELQDDPADANVKVIVLVSDGKPQCNTMGRESMSEPCPAQRARDAQDQAARAAADNITIYTVSLCDGCNSTDEAEQYAFMRTLVTGAGKAYSTTDADNLEGILADIARSIPVALVE